MYWYEQKQLVWHLGSGAVDLTEMTDRKWSYKSCL